MALEGKRVVVIGSSSVGERGTGALGRALRELLPGAQLQFIGRSGYGFAGSASKRLAGTQAQRRSLLQQLQMLQPFDLVLVAMGSNPTGTAAQLREAMQWFDSQVGPGRVRWIGPPVYSSAYHQKITDTYDTVGRQVLGSRYVSSRDWTYPDWGRARDGVHFTLEGARAWAHGIVSWLRRQKRGGGIEILLAVALAALTAHWYLRKK
jgi:lysophospholipase L1-like esterase